VAILVVILGVVIACGGLVILILPATPQRVARRFLESGREYLAVSIRLAFGVLFVVVAPYCRPDQPWVGTTIRLIGVFTILVAGLMLAMGRRRLRAILEWAMNLPPSTLRIFAPIALVFGGFLIYAGL
jgi:hypothetical protein